MLYSASRDKSIKVWDLSTGNCKKTLNGHNEWVRCLSINTQGNLLASSSDDEIILVWNIETSQQMYSLNGHENKIEHIKH
jgi:platelet-activating factor acetylhydrolase IB subunit alpha